MGLAYAILAAMTNAKPPRSIDEVQKLAAAWAAKWTPADGIEPWLRRHMDEMQRLIREDRWSWRDLARSLNEAGITYSGGTWTAALLGDKVAGLRSQQRKRDRKAASRHAFPVDALRDVLGSLGTVGQLHLTVNIQGATSGPMTATVDKQQHGNPAQLPQPAPTPQATPLPAPAADPAKVPQSVPPDAASSAGEPPRRTFGYAKPRGLDPAAAVPGTPAQPSAPGAEPPTPAAPTVNVDDVLARFSPGTTKR